MLLFHLGKSTYYAETAGAEVLEEARDALLAVGDHETAAEAETFLAYLAHHHGWRDQYFGHLDRAAALVSDLGPSRAKAEVLVDLANHLAMARNHERTIAEATEALDIARELQLSELEASALAMIGVSRGLSGDLGGRDDLERAIAIAERVDTHLSAHCCGILADLECQMGELESAFALQARARMHAERFGHIGFVRWLAAERVGEGYWTGDWDDALALADSFIAESETGTAELHGGLLPRDARPHPARPRRECGRARRCGPGRRLRTLRRRSSDALSGSRLRGTRGGRRRVARRGRDAGRGASRALEGKPRRLSGLSVGR